MRSYRYPRFAYYSSCCAARPSTHGSTAKRLPRMHCRNTRRTSQRCVACAMIAGRVTPHPAQGHPRRFPWYPSFGGRVLHVGIGKRFLMRHRQIQAFRNIRPGFGYEAPGQRQGLPLDQLHQQPQPTQAEQPHPARSSRAGHAQDRAQIGQIGPGVARPTSRSLPSRDHPQRCDRHRQPAAAPPVPDRPSGSVAIASRRAWCI